MAKEPNLATCIALFAPALCFAIHPATSSTYKLSPFCLTDTCDKSDTRIARSKVDCASQCSQTESCFGFLYPHTGSCSLLLGPDCFSTPRCSSNDPALYQRILSPQEYRSSSTLSPSGMSCICVGRSAGLLCQRQPYNCDELYAYGQPHGSQWTYLDIYKNQSLTKTTICDGDERVTLTYIFINTGLGSMSKSWDVYSADGFSGPDGVFWTALEGVLGLNRMGSRDVTFVVQIRRPDESLHTISHLCTNFIMEDETKGYAFTTDPCTLDNTKTDYLTHAYGLRDVVGMSSGRPFLASDRDDSQGCAGLAGAGWWFPDCSQGVVLSPLGYPNYNRGPKMILPGFNMSDPELRRSIAKSYMALIVTHD